MDSNINKISMSSGNKHVSVIGLMNNNIVLFMFITIIITIYLTISLKI